MLSRCRGGAAVRRCSRRMWGDEPSRVGRQGPAEVLSCPVYPGELRLANRWVERVSAAETRPAIGPPGTTQIGHRAVPHIVVSTITDVIRRIAGVRAVAVIDQDIDGGQITQQSFDWRAQDRAGNIWSVGSYTRNTRAGGSRSDAMPGWLGSTGQDLG
jgi:hypothetical protein